MTETENKSGGPRTEEGKQRSSQNAIKHGLFAKRILIGGESQEEFDHHYDSFLQEFHPEGPDEEDLVLLIATTTWRRRRIPQLEALAMDKAVETGDTECQFTKTFSIYEQRLNRSIDNARKTLQELQNTRNRRREAQFRFAMALRRHTKEKNIPWKPADQGFVFSTQKLDNALDLVERITAAKLEPFAGMKGPEIAAYVARMGA